VGGKQHDRGHDYRKVVLMDAGWAGLAKRFESIGECTAAAPDVLTERAQIVPGQNFLVFDHHAASYRAFDLMVSRFASGLSRAGVAPGDRVAFQCESRMEMAELLFATWRAGAIGVPLNVYLKGKSLEHQLLDSAASTLIVDQDGYKHALSLCDRLPDLQRIVLLDEVTATRQESGIDTIGVDELCVDDLVPFSPRAVTDPALIMYTSGTTGLPKGCVVSFRYLHHVGREWDAILDVQAGDVFYSAAPFYHFGGVIPVMATLTGAATIAVEEKFTASRFFERVAEVGATHTIGVGWLVVALLNQPERATDALNPLRVMMATPVSESDRERFESRFGVELLSEVYGQTEVTLAGVSVLGGTRKPGTAGRAAPWHEVAILDELDQQLPPGDVGEISIRPRIPGAMYDGYWGCPSESVAASGMSWHHTGDLGRLDTDGFITFVDRKSDRLRRRGENIASFEVESVITAHHAIAEAAVFAVPSPGEVDDTIKACIVLAPGASLEPKEIADFFATDLPYYAAPRFVEIVEALPRNASGRVMKYQLKESAPVGEVWDLHDMQLTVPHSRRRA
jgi:crotonobetaine/carnitine-CoA ligase